MRVSAVHGIHISFYLLLVGIKGGEFSSPPCCPFLISPLEIPTQLNGAVAEVNGKHMRMTEIPSRKPVGRPSRFRKYEELLDSLPPKMTKRALYRDQIGLFRGERGVTAWVKIRIGKGQSKEIKLGQLSSWSWEKLEAKRTELQGRADRGEPLEDSPSVTFSKQADDWLARKRHTAKRYGDLKGHVDNHLNPTFGKKALDAISVAEVNAWMAKQRATMKPATVQRQRNTLNAILNDAVRSGILPTNPVRLADPIRGIESRQRFLDPEELKILLEKADAIEAEENDNAEKRPREKRGWLRNFVLWSINTGMRRQEILNLTWNDIRELDDNSTLVDVGTLKGGSQRMLRSNGAMNAILDAMRKLERKEGDNRVFPISAMTVRRKLHKLFKATGISDVRLHELRRTHATALVHAGIDIRSVSQRLGHKDTKMLMKVYAAFVGDGVASDKAQELFGHLGQPMSSKPAEVDENEEAVVGPDGTAAPTDDDTS